MLCLAQAAQKVMKRTGFRKITGEVVERGALEGEGHTQRHTTLIAERSRHKHNAVKVRGEKWSLAIVAGCGVRCESI